MLHFLQMPIEDELIAELLPRQPPGVAMTNAGPVLDPSQAPIPFADVGNPVMAQVVKTRVKNNPMLCSCSF